MKMLKEEQLAGCVGGNRAVIPPTPSTPAAGQFLASLQEPAVNSNPPIDNNVARFKDFDSPFGTFITESFLFA